MVVIGLVDSADNRRFTLVTACVDVCTICVRVADAGVDIGGDNNWRALRIHNVVYSLWMVDPLRAHGLRTICTHFVRSLL